MGTITFFFQGARYNLNLNELFIYKLLERLGVGAQVEFVTNDCGSRWIVYIGSKRIDNFKTIGLIEEMKKLEETMITKPTDSIDLSRYIKPVVQMLFLYTVLELGDHHQENMGINMDGLPFIIDFICVPIDTFDVKKNFYTKIRCGYGEKLRIK